MPDSRISISIINYRTAKLTCACLASIRDDWIGNSREPGLNVVVVDNASDDGSDAIIARWIDEAAGTLPVRLVQSATNCGFAGGHNLGLAETSGAPWHLILNSDAVLLPGSLAALVRAIETAPSRTGLISPTILDAADRPAASRFRRHGMLSELVRAAGTDPVTRMFPRGRVAIADPSERDWFHPDWVSFAAVLVRREMIEVIGPMDEGYFLYFEDAEYCLRAARGGWRIGFAPEARIRHEEGGSGDLVASKATKRRLPAYYYASRSRFLYQAHGRLGLWGANMGWHLGRAMARLRPLLGRPVPPVHDGEARDLWTNALDPLGPRHAPWESLP